MNKNKWICIILDCAALIGLGGLHDFYLGRKGWGILKLFTFNLFLFGAIWDLYRLLKNEYCTDLIDYGYNSSYAPSSASFNDSRISDEGIEWRIGSEKQIDWAEEVVRGTLRRTHEMLTDGVTNGKITDEERVYVADAVETSIVTFDDANWWIDRRNESLKKKLYIILEDDDEAKNIIRKMA